jgi:hypothetical protein
MPEPLDRYSHINAVEAHQAQTSGETTLTTDMSPVDFQYHLLMPASFSGQVDFVHMHNALARGCSAAAKADLQSLMCVLASVFMHHVC